jgi:ATP-dependent Lon protease
MVKLIIERYTREAGIRNLERNLAALARAAAVKVAEQVNTLTLGKEIQPITSTLLDSRLADSGEVEMEVIPIGHDISNSYENPSHTIVDEAMLEKVLGVCSFINIINGLV